MSGEKAENMVNAEIKGGLFKKYSTKYKCRFDDNVSKALHVLSTCPLSLKNCSLNLAILRSDECSSNFTFIHFEFYCPDQTV